MTVKTLLCAASAAAIATAASAQDPDLLVFDWSGYEEEGFYQQYIDTYGAAPRFRILRRRGGGVPEAALGLSRRCLAALPALGSEMARCRADRTLGYQPDPHL